MYICLCKGVTDTQIKQCIEDGASSLKQVRKELGVATQCCKCLPEARALVDEQVTIKNAQQHCHVSSHNDLFFCATAVAAQA